MRILVVDNYDSFVFNLVQYLGQLGVEADVWRNDDPRLDDPAAAAAQYDGVLLSPGPGTPQRAGQTMPMVEAARAAGSPRRGGWVGPPGRGAGGGARGGRAPARVHGKTSLVHHNGHGVLAGLPDPFTATRYHSLTVLEPTIPDELEITGRTDSGVVMGFQHRELPIHGVQFHPESVLTQGGHRMLANWLAVCGYEVAEARVAELEQEVAAALA